MMPTREQIIYFGFSHSRGTQLALDAADINFLTTNGYMEFIGKSVLASCEWADLKSNWVVFAYLGRKYTNLLKEHIRQASCTVIWAFHEENSDLDAFLASI